MTARWSTRGGTPDGVAGAVSQHQSLVENSPAHETYSNKRAAEDRPAKMLRSSSAPTTSTTPQGVERTLPPGSTSKTTSSRSPARSLNTHEPHSNTTYPTSQDGKSSPSSAETLPSSPAQRLVKEKSNFISPSSPFDDNPEGDTSMFRQPETRAITQDQLVNEVKGIYAGLVMVEKKCVEIDQQQSQTTNKLSTEQWQALIALHRTLLHEHRDFFLASQYPSASAALKRLATKYAMPAHSLDHMLAFVYLAYFMMALLMESDPSLLETWIECLGDLARYRMAIEEADLRDREIWSGVARMWHNNAAGRSPRVGRIQNHLTVLARPNIVQQLLYYSKALVSVVPFFNTGQSVMLLFTPFLENVEMFSQMHSSSEVAFANISLFYAVSKQSSYRFKEIDWRSYYSCIHSALFDPNSGPRPRSIRRRQESRRRGRKAKENANESESENKLMQSRHLKAVVLDQAASPNATVEQENLQTARADLWKEKAKYDILDDRSVPAKSGLDSEYSEWPLSKLLSGERGQRDNDLLVRPPETSNCADDHSFRRLRKLGEPTFRVGKRRMPGSKRRGARVTAKQDVKRGAQMLAIQMWLLQKSLFESVPSVNIPAAMPDPKEDWPGERKVEANRAWFDAESVDAHPEKSGDDAFASDNRAFSDGDDDNDERTSAEYSSSRIPNEDTFAVATRDLSGKDDDYKRSNPEYGDFNASEVFAEVLWSMLDAAYTVMYPLLNLFHGLLAVICGRFCPPGVVFTVYLTFSWKATLAAATSTSQDSSSNSTGTASSSSSGLDMKELMLWLLFGLGAAALAVWVYAPTKSRRARSRLESRNSAQLVSFLGVIPLVIFGDSGAHAAMKYPTLLLDTSLILRFWYLVVGERDPKLKWSTGILVGGLLTSFSVCAVTSSQGGNNVSLPQALYAALVTILSCCKYYVERVEERERLPPVGGDTPATMGRVVQGGRDERGRLEPVGDEPPRAIRILGQVEPRAPPHRGMLLGPSWTCNVRPRHTLVTLGAEQNHQARYHPVLQQQIEQVPRIEESQPHEEALREHK